MENLEKYVYVIVNSVGGSYTTHSKAAEYGMVAYHHWSGLPCADAGDVLKVVKSVIVNGDDDCYILKDRQGIEYLISTRFCTKINFR